MARLLLVDDDLDQLELRKLLLERAGHEVGTAADAGAALELFRSSLPDLVLTDLRLPTMEDGLALIRRLRQLSDTVRIVVFSGLAGELCGTPEGRLVDQMIGKPARTDELIRLIGRLTAGIFCLLLAWSLSAADFPFKLAEPSEVVAELRLSSPGSDWSKPGREAAIAELRVDGGMPQHVVVYAGAEPRTYNVFLGELPAGGHRLNIQREPRHSAPDSRLEVAGARFRPSADAVVSHAPVLFARANTIGRFSDIPLITYCERLVDDGRPILQYTVVFSNEDGGTSTRALMARWGRTTDIEYVYRVDPATGRAIVQGRGHKDLEFSGPNDRRHALLMPVTDNNMVAGEGPSALRFQPAPILVDLSRHSREQVMDDDPVMYRIASQELEREAKLRPFGTLDGEKVSDPRNYLYIEAHIANQNSRLAAVASLGRGWVSSNLGRQDYSIERSGWVRTTIELPPGTAPEQVGEIGFQCLVADKAHSGMCRILEVSKVFFLDSNYRPGASLFHLRSGPRTIPTGEIATWSLKSK